MPRISFSIVNTDNWEVLADCLRSIQRASGFSMQSVEAVVIDNASSKLASEAFLQEFAWVTLVRREDRHGFGSNHNEAFRHASGDLFVVLNDDTLLAADFLDSVEQFFVRHADATVMGPWVNLLDGTRQGTFGPFPTFASEALLWSVGQFGATARWLLRRRTRADIRPQGELRVPWLCGVCMVWRRERYALVGGFDEAFRIYYEDAEICHRAQALWPGTIWFSSDSKITHLEGSTMGSKRTGDHRREVENIVSAAVYLHRAIGPRTGRRFWSFARTANKLMSSVVGVLHRATRGTVDPLARADRRLSYMTRELQVRAGAVARLLQPSR